MAASQHEETAMPGNRSFAFAAMFVVVTATIALAVSTNRSESPVAQAGSGPPTPTPSPTASPTASPAIPSTVSVFVNDTGEVVNDLHVDVDLAASVSLSANALGCPLPSLPGSALFSSFDVVWPAACADPGESVTLEIFSDCFAPACGPPVVSSHFWTLDGTPVPSPTPAPLCGNTPAGNDVSVRPLVGGLGSPGGVELIFSTVTICGTTTAATTLAGPAPPAGLQVIAPGAYYDLNTTATFTGPVTVCIGYDETQLAGSELDLVLLHQKTGDDVVDDKLGLIDGTPIAASDIICGETLTLSIFAVAEPVPPTASPTPSPAPTATPELRSLAWGDYNCSGDVDPVDSLAALNADGKIIFNTNGCPEPGTVVEDMLTHVLLGWGDVDCNGEITPVDSLDILRNDAGLGYNREPGCPLLGATGEWFILRSEDG